MKTYVFKPTVTMKDYNAENYWIDRDILGSFEIDAESLTDAIRQFCENTREDEAVTISKNAEKKPSIMYYDDRDGNSIPCGFVFTGKTMFQDEYGHWTDQYVDVWTDIRAYIKQDIHDELEQYA